MRAALGQGIKTHVSSIATSGHKFVGTPVPCGLYLTKVGNQMRPPGNAEYVGSPDTTFGGSRSALAPLSLWNSLARRSLTEYIKDVVNGQKVAEYAVKQLSGIVTGKGPIHVYRGSLSLRVLFTCPPRASCGSTPWRPFRRSTWRTSSSCPTWTTS